MDGRRGADLSRIVSSLRAGGWREGALDDGDPEGNENGLDCFVARDHRDDGGGDADSTSTHPAPDLVTPEGGL
jgi:hypothetical protein